MKIFWKGFFLSSLVGLFFLVQPALAVDNTPAVATPDSTDNGNTPAVATPDYAGSSLFGGGTQTTSSGVVFPSNTGLADPSGGIAQILTTFLTWLLGIFGILALISFVVSGSMYLLAAGNDKMIERAKSTMVNSIIGVIIALSGFILIQAIDSALSASSSVL